VASSAIVDVLLDAFEVDPERRPAIEGETVASLAHPWFTHYIIRDDGEPATVARRATFEGVTYLSSIGTAGWARGRGLGTIVTRMAASEGLAEPHTRLSRGLRRQPRRHRRLPAIRVRAAGDVLSRHAPVVTDPRALERILDALAAAPGEPLALGWATVELERAASELAAELGISAAAFLPPPIQCLGARCCRNVVRSTAGHSPSRAATEGRLAACCAPGGSGRD
jgi:hypothetical protein